MVTLREPASRAFSSYLYLRRHGLAAPTFIETAEREPALLNEGRYATHLRRYLGIFDPKVLHVTVFDDLQGDPQAFLDDITDWLEIGRHPVTAEQLAARLPASRARWPLLAATAKRAANWARRHDGAHLVGRIKRSALVEHVLYRELGDTRPTMSPDEVCYVRERLKGEIIGVEKEFDISLRQRWGWP
jgi:hypothetical protein